MKNGQKTRVRHTLYRETRGHFIEGHNRTRRTRQETSISTIIYKGVPESPVPAKRSSIPTSTCRWPIWLASCRINLPQVLIPDIKYAQDGCRAHISSSSYSYSFSYPTPTPNHSHSHHHHHHHHHHHPTNVHGCCDVFAAPGQILRSSQVSPDPVSCLKIFIPCEPGGVRLSR